MSAIFDRVSFIRANTTVMAPPLVPEVKLHLAHEAVPLWQKTEDELGELVNWFNCNRGFIDFWRLGNSEWCKFIERFIINTFLQKKRLSVIR